MGGYSRIATVFPDDNTIVTLPGIHATQRVAYTDHLNEQRVAANQPPLSENAQEDLWLLASTWCSTRTAS